SLGCALAPSMGFLIAARVAQGVGGAMLEPATLALIKATFPRERLVLAFGVQGITAGVATAVGPTLGGVLTTTFSWRWIFLVNVPVGLVAIAATLLAVAESRAEGASRRIDVAGFLLSGAGVFFLVFALVEGQKLGWGSGPILGALAASILSFGAFVLVEMRVREPLVDLSLFGDRLFSVGNALRGMTLFVLLAAVFVLPLYWQTQLGYSALQAGLVLLPLSVASFFLSPIAGSLADRVDVRWLVGSGFVAVAASAFWLSRLTPESGWAFFVAPLVLFGAGLAFLFAPTVTATLRNVPDEKSGVASGISFTGGEVGAALGVAVAAAVLQNRLLANAEEALSATSLGLPPGVEESILSGLSEGATGAPAGLEGSRAGIEGLVRGAFADAVGSGLLLVAAAALLGALLAFTFFSTRPEPDADLETPTETKRSDAIADRSRM
ncbi:MAG: DHA2 family efflux MFS transporter permease subunit, partial [Rubrobacter sp.]